MIWNDENFSFSISIIWKYDEKIFLNLQACILSNLRLIYKYISRISFKFDIFFLNFLLEKFLKFLNF